MQVIRDDCKQGYDERELLGWVDFGNVHVRAHFQLEGMQRISGRDPLSKRPGNRYCEDCWNGLDSCGHSLAVDACKEGLYED